VAEPRNCPSLDRHRTVTGRVTPTIVSSPSTVNDSGDPSTRVEENAIVGCRSVCRTFSRRVLAISARSAEVRGLTPPVPSRTWNESTSISTVTEHRAGSSVSTTAVPRQRATSMVRSWPALAPRPVRAVLTRIVPTAGPSR
jgi:hypothetical protein